MKHSYIEIENFKGIENLRFEFNRTPVAPVYTLVGLNESGKTTLLEAIYFLESKTSKNEASSLHPDFFGDLRQLVPISKLSNFNGRIRLECGYELSDDEISRVDDFLRKKLHFEPVGGIPKSYLVELVYEFKDSLVLSPEPRPHYYFDLVGKSGKSKKIKDIDGEAWEKLVDFLDEMRPSVLFFPNFLFEFPDRIYLENPPKKDAEKHLVYRNVLQDVLHAVDPTTTISTHIVGRMKGDISLMDDWLSSSLDSLLTLMGSHISRTVFPKWNKIFPRQITAKEITFRKGMEKLPDSEEQSAFLQLRLREGTDNYAISQRSLGFRWFFSFLLFTIYRTFRGGNKSGSVLFLFDEPASNLHSTAQTQLRGSFSELGENSVVIYTTHSQHLINPAWLETAFVVKNEGLRYDDAEDDFRAANTQISVTRYRDFVASYPDQTRYFQPILDVLDFYPSELENVPDVVMLEGKNDFYTLKYVFEKLLTPRVDVKLMPGGGAGSLDNAIRLYLAWGRNFIVVLDSDKAGNKQKERYCELFGDIVKDKVFSLRDIDKSWDKKRMEGLFTPNEQVKIQRSVYRDMTVFNKTHFNRAIQELYLTDSQVPICGTSAKNFRRISDFISNQLAVR